MVEMSDEAWEKRANCGKKCGKMWVNEPGSGE